MANRIVHFEIEANDKKRASKFYADTFGWDMQAQPEEYGGYIMAVTGDPKEPGGINGGLYQVEHKELNAYSCVISVDDIKKSISAVRAAGGKVHEHNMDDKGNDMGEVIDIPQVGLYAKCEDTEGNRFTLLQPSPAMTPKQPSL